MSAHSEIATRDAGQLGQALKRLRVLAEVTQSQLSQMAQLRQGTISKVEKGVPTTTLSAVYDICTALELEIVIRPKHKERKNKKFNPGDVFK